MVSLGSPSRQTFLILSIFRTRDPPQRPVSWGKTVGEERGWRPGPVPTPWAPQDNRQVIPNSLVWLEDKTIPGFLKSFSSSSKAWPSLNKRNPTPRTVSDPLQSLLIYLSAWEKQNCPKLTLGFMGVTLGSLSSLFSDSPSLESEFILMNYSPSKTRSSHELDHRPHVTMNFHTTKRESPSNHHLP